jgi:hypothetical protein
MTAERLRTPNRRIEGRCLLDDPLHDEREVSACRLVAIPDAFRGSALDPLRYAFSGDAVESEQRIAAKGNAPRRGSANVGAKDAVLDADGGVAGRWERESTEGRPEEGRRRDEAAHQVAARGAHGLANQHRASATEAAADKKVQACAVGGGEARHALAAHVQIRVAQLPREHDAPVAFR